jgi:hypothetical protein
MVRSERPSLVVIENHDELVDMNDEITTNYIESGESYDWKTTVVKNCWLNGSGSRIKVHGRVPKALRLGQIESRN